MRNKSEQIKSFFYHELMLLPAEKTRTGEKMVKCITPYVQ